MERCVGQIWKVIVVPSVVRYPLIVMQEYMFSGFPHDLPAYLPQKLVQTRPLPKCNVRRRLVRERSREAALPVFCRSFPSQKTCLETYLHQLLQ
jgi:hypothetical protein